MRKTRTTSGSNETLGSPQGTSALDRRLLYAVLGVLILILVIVLYGVMVGVVSPIPARTATEARITILESMVKNNSDSGKAHFDYVTGLAAAGNTREAYRAVGRAREILTGWELAYADAAEVAILFNDGNYAEARDVARSGYERDVKERNAFVETMRQKNVSFSIQQIEVEPLVTMLIFEGRAAGAMEDWAGAIKSFTEALALSPQSADILVLRAAAYEESNDTSAALADYQAALTFIPDYEPALKGVERLGGES